MLLFLQKSYIDCSVYMVGSLIKREGLMYFGVGWRENNSHFAYLFVQNSGNHLGVTPYSCLILRGGELFPLHTPCDHSSEDASDLLKPHSL